MPVTLQPTSIKYKSDGIWQSADTIKGDDYVLTEQDKEDIAELVESPSANVTKSGDTATITVTDKSGTTIAQVTDGEDGYSPTVTVTDITGGHRVTVTDADGAHSFDVMDGTGSVQDVQVNGVSVLDAQGVANVPSADLTNFGVVKVDTSNNNSQYGVWRSASGIVRIAMASETRIKNGVAEENPITPFRQHLAAFYGFAKAAGDTTQSASSNAVGTYTETAKSKISDMLSAPVSVTGTTPTITALSGIQYVCGEVSTLDITLPASGIVDVVFTSGSTPTVLTITPPTGVTVKWANGFDPTSLDANTTYELNIKDGLGVAAAWT